MDASQPRSVSELDFTWVSDGMPSTVDWRDQVIYQVQIDRFDSDKADQVLAGGMPAPFQPSDPESRLRFKGGKIRGIAKRLDFFQGVSGLALFSNC